MTGTALTESRFKLLAFNGLHHAVFRFYVLLLHFTPVG